MKRLLTVAVLALLLAIPLPALAHGTLFTFKQIDGEQLIMVTHNVHDARAGVPITYNLRLYNIDGQLLAFQKVEAEVKLQGKSQTQQTVSVTPNADANFTYAFPHQGEYQLLLTFLDNDKQVAHGDFPIIVEKGLDKNFFAPFFTPHTGLAFLLGAGLMIVYQQRHLVRRFLIRLAKRRPR